ncbi:hypothetical protein ABGN05_16770 [Aquibium sp. LZ166]|uniref:Uncharacterized protein n=1 Tax=Aquibium pacificus TaxID=3153579 RepID=A0ABV3SKK2_9HYPH
MSDESFEVGIDRLFERYMADVALRLGYVEQTFSLDVVGSSFLVTAKRPADQPAIMRKINHALYREKVRADSEPLRARFLELLSQK